jgi:hypothetical protein
MHYFPLEGRSMTKLMQAFIHLVTGIISSCTLNKAGAWGSVVVKALCY